jgi:hypothetical protein
MIGGEEAFGFALVERGHDLCIGPGVAGVKRSPDEYDSARALQRIQSALT